MGEGGGAEMTGAALMQGNSPLTGGGRVEGLRGSNRPPKMRRVRPVSSASPQFLQLTA